jgi:hypothetical protein
MTSWTKVSSRTGHPLTELPGDGKTEYDRMDGYIRDWAGALLTDEIGRVVAERYVDEALIECDPGSSLFIFGTGPSTHPNTFKHRANFERIVASDIVEESSLGLYPSIEFRIVDMLQDDLDDFDYIFSSHTIEHFSREDLMEVILPKCLQHARKAVIFIAPYRDVAWGHPFGAHKVLLNEHDELTAQALKWKRIRDNVTATPPQYGIELVLWFEGQAQAQEE